MAADRLKGGPAGGSEPVGAGRLDDRHRGKLPDFIAGQDYAFCVGLQRAGLIRQAAGSQTDTILQLRFTHHQPTKQRPQHLYSYPAPHIHIVPSEAHGPHRGVTRHFPHGDLVGCGSVD